jgi:hypothetical protein
VIGVRTGQNQLRAGWILLFKRLQPKLEAFGVQSGAEEFLNGVPKVFQKIPLKLGVITHIQEKTVIEELPPGAGQQDITCLPLWSFQGQS